MANLINLKHVLTLQPAAQTFRLVPHQAWLRGGPRAQPFSGITRARPFRGQIWPRGEYQSDTGIGLNLPDPPNFAVTVEVEPEEFTLVLAGANTRQLTAHAYDADGNELFGHPTSWLTSDASVATVDQTGLVTGVGSGDCTITAVVDGIPGTSECHVFTVSPDVATVTVHPDPVSVFVGRTRQLWAEVRAAGGELLDDRVVTWESDDETKVTVDDDGLLTGVAASGGSAVVVTATCETIEGTADVYVNKAPLIADVEAYISFDEDSGEEEFVSVLRDDDTYRVGSSTTNGPQQYETGPDGSRARSVGGSAGNFQLGNADADDMPTGPSYPQSAVMVVGHASWSVAAWFDPDLGTWGGGFFPGQPAIDGSETAGCLLGDAFFASDNPVRIVPALWAPENGGMLLIYGVLAVDQVTRVLNITEADLVSGWNHIAIVNNAATGTLRAYLNGVQRFSGPSVNIANMGSGVARWYTVGNYQPTTTAVNSWGSIDELYIFHRALSAVEVALLAGI